MPRSRSVFAALAVAVSAFQGGCIAYNDSCQPLVEDPDAIVGYLASNVLLDKVYTRHDNNALGQLVADALLHAEDDSSRPAVLGVVNGGSLRQEGLCATRTELRQGPLTDGVLHELILFENLVVTVDLTEAELVAMMEKSVEALYPAGQVIASPSGAFLHLSQGSSMRVDCGAQGGAPRVTALTVNDVPVPIPARTDPSIRYRVAMNAYLLDGGDGYGEALGNAGQNPDRNPVQARKLGGTEANLASAYMREKHPTPVQALREEPRITFQNCALPARPAGR
ncbi:5'-nucleotidase C-terminal domain-containing protein [Corallococcus macrosporus]|uniref:5'-nucleotidase family protein n=1 Tax=Myxococcus fulvus (strain ATCC BAA-855 / HW-1) TaxID=483219 RepID=F8CN64_MYXFH|nr:5'-nucleotidase [Corallococcus macrosporus]AEI67870.1 5'-nucleotidase family protein [Corallococcus macrosporus]